VDKALEVLEAFSELDGGINLSCLSDQLNMNKSGVYRLLQVFKQRGYVEQKSNNGQYQLGIAAYKVGQNIVSRMKVLRSARPLMEKLSRELDETVYLAVPNGSDVFLFDSAEALTPVNVMSLKGRTYPLESCAAGELLLAFARQNLQLELGEPASDGADLSHIKIQGYAVDRNRLGDSVVSVSVPLLDDSKHAAGALCLIGPSCRFDAEYIQDSLLPPLIEAGHTVSARLGCFSQFSADRQNSLL